MKKALITLAFISMQLSSLYADDVINLDMLPPGLIVECSANTCIPFRLKVSGDLCQMEPCGVDLLYLRMQRDFYVRVEGSDNVQFSLDKKEWKPLSDMVTGNINAMLSIEEGRPVVTLRADVNVD